MIKYEYKFVSKTYQANVSMEDSNNDMLEISNRLGQLGWNMVSCTSDLSSHTSYTYKTLIFKRKLP